MLTVVEGLGMDDCVQRLATLKPDTEPDSLVVSDAGPLDPIENEFPETPEEAWPAIKNRVQLILYKEITPVVVFLTWPHPHCTGREQSHEDDMEIRPDTFVKLAARYGYDLDYHGKSRLTIET